MALAYEEVGFRKIGLVETGSVGGMLVGGSIEIDWICLTGELKKDGGVVGWKSLEGWMGLGCVVYRAKDGVNLFLVFEVLYVVPVFVNVKEVVDCTE